MITCAEGSSRQGEGFSRRVTTSSALLPSSPGLSILRAAWHVRSPNSLWASEVPRHRYTCPRTAPLQATCYWNVSTWQSQLPLHCSRPVQRRGGYQSAGQSPVTSFITVGVGLGEWHPSLSPQREKQAPWQSAPDPHRASCPAPRINVLSVGMALAKARSRALFIQLAQGP